MSSDPSNKSQHACKEPGDEGKGDMSPEGLWVPISYPVVSNFIISQPMSTGLASHPLSLLGLHISGVWRGAFS